MSLISFTPVVDGTTAVASGVNTPLSTIYNDYNGNITDANIAASAAIAFSKISGGSSTALGSWQSWTPTFTNLSGGTITQAKYIQIGKTVFYRLEYTLAGAGVAGSVAFTLPVTSVTMASLQIIGNAEYTAAGTDYFGIVGWDSTTTGRFYAYRADTTYLIQNQLSSTIPNTWASGNKLKAHGFYEAA